MASPMVPAISGKTPALAIRRRCLSKDGMSRTGVKISQLLKLRSRTYQDPLIEGEKKMELEHKCLGLVGDLRQPLKSIQVELEAMGYICCPKGIRLRSVTTNSNFVER